MNFLDKLDVLKAAKGDTNASLARNAGIPVTTIYGLYQKGYSNMKLSTLEALCEYFGVSLDYLARDSVETDHTVSDVVSAEESELIKIYHDLNATGQSTLMNMARSLNMNPDMKRGSASSITTA